MRSSQELEQECHPVQHKGHIYFSICPNVHSIHFLFVCFKIYANRYWIRSVLFRNGRSGYHLQQPWPRSLLTGCWSLVQGLGISAQPEGCGRRHVPRRCCRTHSTQAQPCPLLPWGCHSQVAPGTVPCTTLLGPQYTHIHFPRAASTKLIHAGPQQLLSGSRHAEKWQSKNLMGRWDRLQWSEWGTRLVYMAVWSSFKAAVSCIAF